MWSTEKFGEGALRTLRERLLTFLEQTRPAGSARNNVTVVFDGKEDVDSPPWKGTVRVAFSKGTDADGLIKRLVDDMRNPRIAVVVTDDRDITKWVRGSKAKVVSCAEFLRKAAKPGRAHQEIEKPTPLDTPLLSRELMRLWDTDE